MSVKENIKTTQIFYRQSRIWFVKPRSRPWLLGVLALTIMLGLGSRKFAGQIPIFLAKNAGDVLWTVAVYIALTLLLPRLRPLVVLIFSVKISFLVEFSQLIEWPALIAIRETLVGKLLLGSGFLWVDLPRYFAGGILGYAIDKILNAIVFSVVRRDKRWKIGEFIKQLLQ